MSLAVSRRQYSTDLRLEVRRPLAPRNLVFNESTLTLSWTGPVTGPRYTHFNIRIGSDSSAPSLCLPIGTEQLFFPYRDRVTVTCWNETVKTESDPARITTGGAVTWADSAASSFGLFNGYQVEYDLAIIGADLTITSPRAARERERLFIIVFADPVIEYELDFDPAYFVDTASQHLDPAMAWCREWAGRSANGKWHPITVPMQFDPNI